MLPMVDSGGSPFTDNWTLRLLAALAAASTVCGCSCDTLYGYDAPRPSLGKNDSFAVDPTCAVLVIDPTAFALVPRVITLTGRREKTGLGAESVPVNVQIGECSDGDESDGGKDAERASTTALGGGDASDGGVSAMCVEHLRRLERSTAALFELTEGPGCRVRSPSRVECTLDANGEAAFGVEGRQSADELIFGGYLPICVTPLEYPGKGPGKHQTPLNVVPRFGAGRVALAAVPLSDPEVLPPVPAGATCGELLECNEVGPRARFQIGVVSTDIPVGTARSSDFRPVSREVKLRAQLRVLSALPPGAQPSYLSTDPSCVPPASGGDGGTGATGGPSLLIPQMQSATEVLHLCTSKYAASYEVAPVLDVSAPSVDLVAGRTDLPALREAFVVAGTDPNRALYEKDCNGVRTLANAEDVDVMAPFAVTPDGKRILIGACTAPGPHRDPDAMPLVPEDAALFDADVRDGALDSPVSASPDTIESGTDPTPRSLDGGSCRAPQQLQLASGETCKLDL